MAASWDALCSAHFGRAASERWAKAAASAVFGSGADPDEREVRDWLAGSDVAGARYIADFAEGPLRRWPMLAISSSWPPGVGPIRLRALHAPGVGPARSAERFVREELLPCLLQATALVRRAASDPATPIDVTYVDVRDRLRSLPPPSPAGRAAVILPQHINGGVTFHAHRRIVVYRREDACKVLVHELLHAFGLDRALWVHASPAAARAEAEFARRHRVVSAVRFVGLGEAYVESLACYLHARWWSGRRRPAGWPATLKRVAAHIEDVGRRVDRACSLGGRAEFAEGTHAFAYAVCRAAVWATALPALLSSWPPGRPPSDPAAFAAFLDGAIAAWDRRRLQQQKKQRLRTEPSLRMTPLQ